MVRLGVIVLVGGVGAAVGEMVTEEDVVGVSYMLMVVCSTPPAT